MPLIHLDHAHGLATPDAFAIADDWAQAAQRDWGMTVQVSPDVQGAGGERSWQFRRSGADGTLRVTPDRFILDVRLGFLLGTYKDRIESQLIKNLQQYVSASFSPPSK